METKITTYLLYGIVDDLLVTTERISTADVNVVGTLDGGGGLHLHSSRGVQTDEPKEREAKNI